MKRHLVEILPGLVAALMIGCHRQAIITTPKTPLSVTISTNTIHIGDLIHLQLTSVHPTNLHFNPPDLDRGKEIIVRNRQDFSEKLSDGCRRDTAHYTITSLVTGQHVIATSPGIVWTRPDGTTTQAPFPFVAFTVQSTLTGTNADWSHVRDIHDLAQWPNRFPRWLLALLVSAITIALGAGLLRRYLVRARALADQAPPPPPHEIALAALQMLKEKGWIETENYRPFYWELTSILRYYVENRFGIHAPEQTTEEFLAEATKSKLLQADTQNHLFSILDYADAVKFARHRPLQDDMRAAYAAAERLIRETIAEPDMHPAETVKSS